VDAKQGIRAIQSAMKNLVLPLLFLCGVPILAQLPEAPQPKAARKHMIIANLAMYGSSVLGAHATAFGSQNCYREDVASGNQGYRAFGLTGFAGGRFHPWRRSFEMSLPADGVVSLTSYLLHHKHHDLLAVVLPSASAGMQVGIAGVQYAQGCF
jgi:hypothetical protein